MDKDVEVRDHRTTSRGIVTTETGPSDGPVMVMVHGSMDRQSTFSSLARIRSATHRVVTYDRRGYATSRNLGGPYTVDEHVADLLGVVDGRRSLLFGHSYGGALVLAFADRHPELVEGLVVFESPMSWAPFWKVPGGVSAEIGRPTDPGLIAENFMKRMVGERRWNSLPERTKAERRDEGPTLVGDIGDLVRGQPYEFARIDCPVVSGVGTESHERFRRAAQMIADRVSDAFLAPIDGRNHNAHVVDAAGFDRTIIAPLVHRVTAGSWPERIPIPTVYPG